MELPRNKLLLLDGGLATQLISMGFSDIDSDPLWNARFLKTNSPAIAGDYYYTISISIISNISLFLSFFSISFQFPPSFQLRCNMQKTLP